MDTDFDLELYKTGKKDKIKIDENQWRLSPYKSKNREFWRFEKGSRKNRQIKYIGGIERIKELYGDKLSKRKPRRRNFGNL